MRGRRRLPSASAVLLVAASLLFAVASAWGSDEWASRGWFIFASRLDGTIHPARPSAADPALRPPARPGARRPAKGRAAPGLRAGARAARRAHPERAGPWRPAAARPELCAYSPASRRWGRATTVSLLDRAAEVFAFTGNGPVSMGDLSVRGGGWFPPHVSHRTGMDVDLRPVRRDGRQCLRGTTWSSPSYDRRGTIQLVRTIRLVAGRRIKVIFFNDPVLIRHGLTRPWPGHGDHLHVRFCGPRFRNPLYRCS